jgi:hypothetical protein
LFKEFEGSVKQINQKQSSGGKHCRILWVSVVVQRLEGGVFQNVLRHVKEMMRSGDILFLQ